MTTGKQIMQHLKRYTFFKSNCAKHCLVQAFKCEDKVGCLPEEQKKEQKKRKKVIFNHTEDIYLVYVYVFPTGGNVITVVNRYIFPPIPLISFSVASALPCVQY